MEKPRHSARRSPFKGDWNSTLKLLGSELEHLRVSDAVMQIDVRESDIRLDGWPKGEARPASPAVALTFESKHGAQTVRCSAFSDWRSNVRAIALGLEALRKVERYGIAGSGEQYRGFAQLPGPETDPNRPFPNKEEAARFMIKLAGMQDLAPIVVITSPEIRKVVYRDAAKKTHPDTGGDAELFKLLGKAQEMLEAV
jgi:hypothetical protein